MKNKSDKLPKANREILADPVRLIGEDGEMVGVVPLGEALNRARLAGLDLIEVSPVADPPVCKISDFGKYKFASQKRTHDAKKKQKATQVKEIKIRHVIDDHDLQVKMRSIRRFIADRDRVRIMVRFRGREIAHVELGIALLMRMKEELSDVAKTEIEPVMEMRQLLMLLAPL